MLKQGSAKTMRKSTRETQQKQQQAGGSVTPQEDRLGLCSLRNWGEKNWGKSTAQRLGDLWGITAYK